MGTWAASQITQDGVLAHKNVINFSIQTQASSPTTGTLGQHNGAGE